MLLAAPTALAAQLVVPLFESTAECAWSPPAWFHPAPAQPPATLECELTHQTILTVFCNATCDFHFDGESRARDSLPGDHMRVKLGVIDLDDDTSYAIEDVCRAWGVADTSCQFEGTIQFGLGLGACLRAGVLTTYWKTPAYRASITTAADICRAADGTLSSTPADV